MTRPREQSAHGALETMRSGGEFSTCCLIFRLRQPDEKRRRPAMEAGVREEHGGWFQARFMSPKHPWDIPPCPLPSVPSQGHFVFCFPASNMHAYVNLQVFSGTPPSTTFLPRGRMFVHGAVLHRAARI